jgi:hypothetical protein
MAAGWRVTGQVERQMMGPSGQFTPSIEVHFVTDAGTTGSVTVPKTVYNGDEVKRRIEAYVAHIGAVENLTG